ncbi:MAG TPA: hypothetical protein VMV69_10290 [Pirellulales bacterium]|nr:hypothetical protein [Pirellulales bacterium]
MLAEKFLESLSLFEPAVVQTAGAIHVGDPLLKERVVFGKRHDPRSAAPRFMARGVEGLADLTDGVCLVEFHADDRGTAELGFG